MFPKFCVATAALAAFALAPAAPASAKVPSTRTIEKKVQAKLPSLGGWYRSGSWVRECSRSGPRRWDCEVGSLNSQVDSTFVIATYRSGRVYVRRASY